MQGSADGTIDTASVDVGGATLATDAERGAGLRRGAEVGRFVVLGELGAGGMGVVYAAYDPELDRKVALKFLRGGHASPAARARLLREAQALARLNHPNVVAIHDAGAYGERVWLALEFVDGRTLGRWRGERAWSWREVLDVLLQAGRGLQAAHAAGLVHRDFKPDNVMVGDDGRVRVMDLGLARLGEGDAGAGEATDPEMRPEVAMLAASVTQAGVVVGTPGYMAPEQLFGAAVGPAADVFAFAVTLWEALYGARPYAGRSHAELVASLRAGRLRPPPPGRRVPRWLRRVLERGVAADAARRWPDMTVLLQQLSRGQARARVRIAGVALAAAGLAGLGGWAWQRADLARREAACAAEGATIAEVWNDEARARVQAGLRATGVGHAAVTAEKITPWLDRRADEWQAARAEACAAVAVDRRWDADTADRAGWCLDARRSELATLIDELAVADAVIANRAIPVAVGLEPVAPCLDEVRLARQPAPPAEGREELRAVQRALAGAVNQISAGRHAEGLADATAARARAEALAWPPLIAAATHAVGTAQIAAGEYTDAARSLEDAYFAAVEGGAPGVATDAARLLARTLAIELGRAGEARSWIRHAGVLARELEPEPGLRTALVLVGRGIQDVAAGDPLAGRGHYEQALALREAVLGPDHPEVAATIMSLGDTRWRTGDFVAAGELFARGLAIEEAAFGPDSPELMNILEGLGLVRRRAGAYAEARAFYLRALELGERSYGPDHPRLATTVGSLANVTYETGDLAAAQLQYERAIALQAKKGGPEHPDVAGHLNNLANVLYELGDVAAARAAYERALAIWEKAYGPKHPAVAITLSNLGMVQARLGEHAQALALYERSLAVKAGAAEDAGAANTLVNMANLHHELGDLATARGLCERALGLAEEGSGPNNPEVADALMCLAGLALDERRTAEAIDLASRAVAITGAAEAAPERVAEAKFVLARALWAAPAGRGGDRPRADLLATQALEALRTAEGEVAALDDVEAWLATHRDEAP